jgi:hypothetical protein
MVFLVFSIYATSPQRSYVYQSRFEQGTTGDLAESYWVTSPQLVSGSYSIVNDMLQLTSNNRFQVGIGANWVSPTYLNGDWTPWLPVYWKYHSDITFVIQQLPSTLVVENWIAYESYQSYTAMVLYEAGTLYYTNGTAAVALGSFSLPTEFRVVIDADYKDHKLNINWAGHQFSVIMHIEAIGAIPKPFTHFQITMLGTGTVSIKNLYLLDYN